jgi:hypothetical protein
VALQASCSGKKYVVNSEVRKSRARLIGNRKKRKNLKVRAKRKLISRLKIMSNIFLEVSKAKKIVLVLLQENPSYNLWMSVAAQLDFIFQDFDDDGVFLKSAKLERVSDLILGLQAVREIEAGNPELADLLCEIEYSYKMQYGIA